MSSETSKPTEKKTAPFDWFTTFGRDGIRTRYRPRTRIHSLFFTIVPWISVLLLGAAFVLFVQAIAVVPGTRVDLPTHEACGGMRSSLALVVKLNPNPVVASVGTPEQDDDGATIDLLALTVFFNDERFDLSKSHRVASFRNSVAERVDLTQENGMQLYMDKAITHDQTLRLVALLQSAGITHVNYVTQKK